MSKAFTSNSDDDPDPLQAPSLPPGTRNYMTHMGADRLRAEVDRLAQERRQVAGGIEGKDRAQKIEHRLNYLLPRLQALVVVDPLTQPKDRVLFGATVTLSDGQEMPMVWRIVGLDETDLDRGWISWMSPLAQALLEKRVGDRALFKGRSLTILKITYQT